MKLRLWILFALVVLALASGVPVIHDTSRTTSSTVFDRYLASHFPGWSGFHTCLAGPEPNRDTCSAELHEGVRYRHVFADADLTTKTPTLINLYRGKPWVRAFQPVMFKKGSGVANSPSFDWEWVMGGTGTVFDYDGNQQGLPSEIFLFHCRKTGPSTTCENALGDVLRYTLSNS